jgi:hypothetical protein
VGINALSPKLAAQGHEARTKKLAEAFSIQFTAGALSQPARSGALAPERVFENQDRLSQRLAAARAASALYEEESVSRLQGRVKHFLGGAMPSSSSAVLVKPPAEKILPNRCESQARATRQRASRRQLTCACVRSYLRAQFESEDKRKEAKLPLASISKLLESSLVFKTAVPDFFEHTDPQRFDVSEESIKTRWARLKVVARLPPAAPPQQPPRCQPSSAVQTTRNMTDPEFVDLFKQTVLFNLITEQRRQGMPLRTADFKLLFEQSW